MPVAAYSTLVLTPAAPVARLTLARPDRLNALSPEALRELIAAAAELGGVAGLKAVVVAGTGRAFCAGFDLDATGREAPSREVVDLGRQMADAVEAIPALTIAAIHGHCVGGGLVLAAACDLRLAAAGARFAIPEVDFGIPLAWGGVPRLVRELGPALTKELVLTCRPFDAHEALTLRFVNRVVADDELEAAVAALAATLAAKARYLLVQTKAHVNALVEEAYSTGQSFRDADLAMGALRDEESRGAMRRYLDTHGRSREE